MFQSSVKINKIAFIYNLCKIFSANQQDNGKNVALKIYDNLYNLSKTVI